MSHDDGAKSLSRRQVLKAGGLTAAAMLPGAYAFAGERYRFQVNEYPVGIPDLPVSLAGMRVLQISDLHFGPFMEQPVVNHVLRRAAAVGADAIVLTGDYVNGRDARERLDWVLPRFAELEAPLGVYAVLGNHDAWADEARALGHLEEIGISLVHRRAAIERPDGRLWIAGTGDEWTDRCSIDEVLDGVPDEEPRIVLAHNPDTADGPWSARVDLMLSGHTHGGQVRIPGLGAPKLPVRNKRYGSGLVGAAHTQVFISRGLGWAILPVRVNCPPELAVLRLERGARATVAG